MPKRTQEHIVGDTALAEVLSVIAKAGHAVDKVVSDYGEDLLVQTSHANRMDSSRLWFQVKGTEDIQRHRLKQGGLRISVSFEHAAKWARSIDLVAVVLWDIQRGEGWFAVPEEQVDPWEGLTTGPRTTTLRFREEDRFTPEVVDRLAWDSRIHHYWLLAVSARYLEREPGEPERSDRRVLVSMDFLQMLGLLERKESNPVQFRVRQRVKDTFKRALEDADQSEGARSMIYEALIQTLLYEVSEVNRDIWLPTALIEDSVEVLLVMMNLNQAIEELEP